MSSEICEFHSYEQNVSEGVNLQISARNSRIRVVPRVKDSSLDV